LFYALSGFLISWPFWKRKASGTDGAVPRGYAQRRFWKIYPPLALSILVFVPIYGCLSSDWSYLKLGAQWLTGWAFIVPVSGKLNPVMWTLVIEVQFYITLPLLFVSLKRVRPKTTFVIIATLFFLAPLLFRVLTKQVPTFNPKIDPHYPAALDAFAFGVLIAGLENFGFVKKSWVQLGVAGIFLWPMALFSVGWVSLHPEANSFLVNELVQAGLRVSAACLLFFIASPRHLIAHVLCAPWLRWCGIISYEWYLIHQPLVIWSRQHCGPAGGNLLKYAAIVGLPLVLGLVVSAAVYRYFSLPLLRFGREKNKH
jgi:peptidoglycan/LPS O-acetylase OafA/YrhL